ncbi:MFS multidrug resistance transporter [Diaporthe amygdali]|uniref:MFS multidrug resistance transporter n=1 Tax=Phomopsis amygdali TaxID=1214568 RepID=UPI0022FE1400|nr:MFS multidrug resistance transporter [Diaporthe amygdali]KAJ0120096.1 MFS multidrug resistance transporter [Diaporthe amygdali]
MAADPEKNEGGAVTQTHLGTADPDKKADTDENTASVGRGDSDSDSHHAADSHGEVDEKSRHSIGQDEEDDDDEEHSQHHDPEPEGPEGLNTGFPPDTEGGVSRSHSRASSARSRPLIVVPRKERRGLFAQLALIPEVERPYDYSRKTKWTITTIVAVAAAGGPIGSNIFYPALSDMAEYFHTSETIVNLNVAFYMLSMSIFPLWWSSFSETLGRRTIYVISFSLFVVFSVLSAISTNIAMLIVFRVLGGGAAASVQAVGAGTIADLWEPFERGRAMGTFYLGPLAGPLFAPIVGGALAQGFGWQSTMWFLTCFGGVNFLSIVFFLPETLARRKPAAAAAGTTTATDNNNNNLDRTTSLARMSTRQSVAVKTKRGAALLRKAFIDPLSCILYLRFPPVALTVGFAAIAFGALFVLNISVQSTFAAPPYGFSVVVVGLLYIPSSLGYFISSLFGGKWVDSIMLREAEKAGRYDEHGRLVFLPEDRLRENAWLAASMYPAAMLWFGWCADKGVFWLAPMVANFFFGFATMLVFGAATTMLTEFMPKRSSSGVALNNFIRNIFSCVGVVVTEPLIGVMGVGWLCTMVALFAWITGNLCIWLLLRNGSKWRKLMDEKMGDVR